MTTTFAVRRWRHGLTAIAIAGGLVVGTAGLAVAEPDPTTPPPTTPSTAAPSTPAAASTTAVAPSTPSKPQVVATGTAPAPTVAVAGGAAAGSAASADTTKAATQGDVLDQLADEYAVGAGGGQLSNLLKTALKLRNMGFRPSKQYYDEIQAAMAYRPNQNPLIGALKDTIAYQQKIKAQMDILQQAQSKNANSAVMGAGQMPADSNPGQLGASMGSAQAPGAAAAAPAMPAMPPAPVVAAPAAEAPTP